ncbi:MAG: hypothetical protein ACR2PL_22560, partial [Dehalococcoidia bacterium]
AMSLADKVRFSSDLLAAILAVRSRLGRPHWLVLDEAHHLLPAAGSTALDILHTGVDGLCMVTLRPELMAPAALQSTTHLYILGDGAAMQVQAFAVARGLALSDGRDVADLDLLEGEALSLRIAGERIGRPRRFRVASRRTEHHRHVRKYASGNLGADKSFYFRGPESKLNLRAYNVQVFIEMARGVDADTWAHHLQRGDIAAWFRDAIKDPELGDSIAAVANNGTTESTEESRDAVLRLIESRYTAGD